MRLRYETAFDTDNITPEITFAREFLPIIY